MLRTLREEDLAGALSARAIRLKVLSWNIWNGGVRRLDAIEQVLREQDADVVALQEANDRAAVETLASTLQMRLIYGDANSDYAVAWLTRRPMTSFENLRLPVLDKTLLEIEVEGTRFFATHLSAGRTRTDEPHRNAETKAILEAIGSTDAVLVGDFNAVHPDDGVGTPPAEEQAPADYVSRRPVELVLEAGFTDCFRAAHPDEPGWTYLASHPWARIDFVFARGVTARSCEVVRTDASDHFAVVAEL